MKILTILIIGMMILSLTGLTFLDKLCKLNIPILYKLGICKKVVTCETPNILTGQCDNPNIGGNL
jgi:hypothetical protein